MKTHHIFGLVLTTLFIFAACNKSEDFEDPTPTPTPSSPTITIATSTFNVSAEGNTIEVFLQSNVEFKVSIDANWITQVTSNSTREMTAYKLYFKVAPNNTSEKRTAKIAISDLNNTISKNITINQVNAQSKNATMIDGYTFNSTIKEIYGDLSNLKSIEFIVNSDSKPTGEYITLSTNESESLIYGVDNNGHLTIYTEGGQITLSPDSYGIFSDFTSLTSIDLSNINTSKATDLGAMFWGCSSLTNLDLTNFDTSSATSMRGMFYGCSSLTSIKLSNIDTSNVTNMIGMFKKCSAITTLDLSNFNTSNVTTMEEMFTGCTSLTSLDLSSFDTSNVNVMQSTFSNCQSLTSLNLNGFDTSNVTYMNSMFYRCTNLASLDLSNFDTSNVTNMQGMFSMCNSIHSLELDNFTITESTDTKGMFEDFATSAESCKINIPEYSYEWIKEQLTSPHITITFSKKSEIKKALMVDASTFSNTLVRFSSDKSRFKSVEFITNDESIPENNYYIISTPESAYPIYLTHTDVYGIKNEDHLKISTAADEIILNADSRYLFSDFTSLTSLDLSVLNTSNVTDMGGMFWRCSSLTTLDLSHFNTTNVTNMNFMFSGCSEMTSLKLDNFTIKESTSVTNMFEGISSYTQDCTITLPKESYEWVADQLTDSYITVNFSDR